MISGFYKKLQNISKDKSFDEPSQVIAKQLSKAIKDESEIQELLNSDGFQIVLEHLTKAFTSRLNEIVQGDAELKTIKNLFALTLGAKGAEERAEEIFKEFIEN